MNYYPQFLGKGLEQKDCLEAVVRHVLYMMDKGGSACAGLGTDFDGFSGEGNPADAAEQEQLIWAFHKAGLTEQEIDGILYQNVLRLYQEVLR